MNLILQRRWKTESAENSPGFLVENSRKTIRHKEKDKGKFDSKLKNNRIQLELE